MAQYTAQFKLKQQPLGSIFTSPNLRRTLRLHESVVVEQLLRAENDRDALNAAIAIGRSMLNQGYDTFELMGIWQGDRKVTAD